MNFKSMLLNQWSSCSLQTWTKFVCVFDMAISIVKLIFAALEITSILTESDWFHDDVSRFSMANNLSETILRVFAIITSGLAVKVVWENSREKLLIPWLVITAIRMILGILQFLYVATHGQLYEMFACLLLTALLPSMWLIIYTYYSDLKKTKIESPMKLGNQLKVSLNFGQRLHSVS